MWNVKNKANEQMNKIETVSQIQRRNSGCHKVGGGGRKDWEFGMSRCKLLYIGWINNKVLL